MSMPLNDMPIDELIRTARNYANCLQPITTYTEIMHELLNRLDAMRVRGNALATNNQELKLALEELYTACDTGEHRGNGSQSGVAMPDWATVEATRQLLSRIKGGAYGY